MKIHNPILKKSIFFLSLTCIIFFSLWIFQYTTVFLAENLLKQTVEKESNGLYSLRFEKISFHIWNKTIHIKNATLSTQDSLSATDSTTTYHIKTNYFNIQLKNIWKIYFQKDLSIQKIILDNPAIICKKNTENNYRRKHISKELENFYENIRKYLVHFQIKSFYIKNGNIDYIFHTPQKKIVFEFHGVNFAVTNFELWRTPLPKNTHSFYTDNIILEIKNQKIYFENKGYVVSFDNLFIATKEKYMEFKKLKIVKIEQVLNDKNKNICNIDLAHLRLDGVDFLKISHDTLQVESIILEKPSVDIIQNNNFSKNTHIENLISPFFTNLFKSNTINTLHFQKGIIHIQTKFGENISLQNTSFSLSKIRLDSTTLLDAKKHFIEKFTFHIENYKHLLSDKNHQISAENISFLGSDSSFSATNIQVTPQFSSNSKKIYIEQIQIKKIDWIALLEPKKKKIKEIEITNPSIHIILKDTETFPTSINTKPDSVPIYTLPFFQNLFIEKIGIKNAQIKITRSQNIPILSIENLNITISQFPFSIPISLKKIIESKNYEISTGNIIYNIDTLNTLKTEGISLYSSSPMQNILKAKKIYFLSKKNNSSFFTEYAEITNILPPKDIRKEHIHFQKIKIENPNIQIFSSNITTEKQNYFFHTDTCELKNGTLSFQSDTLSLFLKKTNIFIANPPIQHTQLFQKNNWKTIQNAQIDITNYIIKKQNTFLIQGENVTASLQNDTASLRSKTTYLYRYTSNNTDTLLLENTDIYGILWQKIIHGNFECKTFQNTNGKLSFQIFPQIQKHTSDSSYLKKTLIKTLSHYIKHIKIHTLKPHFLSIYIRKEDTLFSFKNIALQISSFEIDKDILEKQNIFFAFQNINIYSGKNSIGYPNFLFTNDSFLFSTKQKLLIFKKNTFSLKKNSTILLQNDSIIWKNIEVDKIFQNGNITLQNMAIYSDNVFIQNQKNNTYAQKQSQNVIIKDFFWYSKKTHLAIESHFTKHISLKKSKIYFKNIELNPFFYDSYNIVMETGEVFPKDTLQTIHFQKINAKHSQDSSFFQIEKLYYKTDNAKTNIQGAPQKNYTTVFVEKIILHKIDMLKSITTNTIVSPIIEIDNPQIHFFKNRKLSTEIKKHPLSEIQIHKSPVPLDIKTIKIQNGFISYQEISKKGHQSGEIVLTNIYANIKDIYKNNTITGDVHFKIMGAGNINTNFAFQQETKKQIHKIEGNLGNFDLRLLNHFLEHVGFTSVKTGMVDTMYFSMELHPEESTGKVVFLYKDLKIKILNKDEEHKRKIGKTIETFFANTFIVSNQNPHPNFTKIGNISYERDTTKSIFSYITKSLLTGIINSIGIKNAENKLKEKTNRKDR